MAQRVAGQSKRSFGKKEPLETKEALEKSSLWKKDFSSLWKKGHGQETEGMEERY